MRLEAEAAFLCICPAFTKNGVDEIGQRRKSGKRSQRVADWETRSGLAPPPAPW